MVAYKLLQPIYRIVKKAHAFVGDPGNAFVEIPYQVSNCLYQVCLRHF